MGWRENTFIIRNGDVVDVQHGEARQTRKVQAGDTYVDGVGDDEIGDIVLRDRRQLSEEGMLVIVCTINKEDGKRISEPDSISRGFVYAKIQKSFYSISMKSLRQLLIPLRMPMFWV